VKAADVRAFLGRPWSGAGALLVGGILIAVVALLGHCPVRQDFAYLLAAGQMLVACAILASWSPAWVLGRILAWCTAVLYFIAYVPDRDEAAYVDFNGMNNICLVVSVYFVACGTLLGFARWRRP